MGNENGEWIMHGRDWNDPSCLHAYQELIALVQEVGFLPLFQNEVEGFSVEERSCSRYWWSGNAQADPWQWREVIARDAQVAYGKFFGKKAGFISLEWLPAFVNYRRDGYDFDARWEDELASIRCKRIMDCFESKAEYAGYELKQLSGFGKDGEKNFDGTMAELQMQTYLVIKDFRRKRNKRGMAYGMAASVYAKPEELWGRDLVTSCYGEEPEESFRRIIKRARELYPEAAEKALVRMLK